MRTSVLTSLLTCTFLAFSTPAHPAPPGDAAGWLKEISQAVGRESFSGDLIYSEGNQWQSLSVVQSVEDDQVWRRTMYLSGEPRMQIRHGDTITCVHEGPHLAGMTPDVFKPFDEHLAARIPQILTNYDASVTPVPGRIAGHEVIQIALRPKSSDRYAYQLWLDADTGLPLRSDLLDTDGAVLQRFQFARLDIGLSVPISDIVTAAEGHTVTLQHTEQSAGSPESDWWPAWLPDGFRISRYQSAASSTEVIHERMLFSDGLATFTVFVDAVSPAGLPDMTRSWSATAAAVRHTEVAGNSYRITVVGEMPAAIIDRIASSVTPAERIATH